MNKKSVVIEMADTQSPDTILLDVHMPEMNGFEACKILKFNIGTKHILVILLTAEVSRPTYSSPTVSSNTKFRSPNMWYMAVFQF